MSALAYPWRWLSGLIEWEGRRGGRIVVGDPRAIGALTGAAAIGALGLYFIGVGVGAGSSGGGVSSPAAVVGAPNTPTIDAAVVDTTTWIITFSAFAGSGADTQDSIHLQVDTAGGTFGSPRTEAKSATQLQDTLSDNADWNANGQYIVRGRQKGTTGGWSGWDTVAVNNTAIVSPSGNIRFDTRSGGAQSIQSAANLAAALTASGFTESDPGSGDLDFATDADGAGSNAFRFDWPGVSAATEVDLMIYRSMGALGITAADTYIQFKIWQTKTASGGGIGTAGDWDCCSQGPGSGKRFVWFRTSGGNTGRLTYAPGGGSFLGQLFVESTYNPSTASAQFNWDNYVSQWITLTARIVPETGVGASDGTIQVWVNSTLTHSVTSADTYSTGLGGELQIGGPTWIGVPQDQTMYVKDIVVWQP